MRIVQRTWVWLRRRSALALLAVTLAGLAAGGLARLAGAGTISDAAWLASAACGIGYAVWSAAESLRRGRLGVDIIALLALTSLIVAYAIGTSVLQWAYQRGDALTAAGMATMATNAVPIAAGFVLFGETLPHGTRAVLQIAAFGCLVASAVALGHQQAPQADQPVPGSGLGGRVQENDGISR